MPELIASPTRVTAAGNKPKLIDEYVGWVNTGTEGLSIAHMRSPGGWVEPGQRFAARRLRRRRYTGTTPKGNCVISVGMVVSSVRLLPFSDN